jgi:hypothetical protein
MRSRLPAIAVLWLLAAVLAGCGGPSGHGAETDPEKGSDAAALNTGMEQELALLGLYAHASPRLGPAELRLAQRLRAREQEYVDAITKAIRGLGGDVEAEAPSTAPPPGGRRGLLEAALSREADAVGYYVGASPHLNLTAPRTLASALAAGHAQQLVVLRQALGAGIVGSIPKAFDTGGEE